MLAVTLISSVAFSAPTASQGLGKRSLLHVRATQVRTHVEVNPKFLHEKAKAL